MRNSTRCAISSFDGRCPCSDEVVDALAMQPGISLGQFSKMKWQNIACALVVIRSEN